ncbi:family 16 glycosylhydrolase [Aquimarina agarivorans]|uniref:family 16 glycosylhydrolase n=1 Tax=Aquimarina agarivorans TaxID=980584 RepID=UPI000248E730|nr:family 16 glycosylhydrolase [Aquimarina agarivorans]
MKKIAILFLCIFGYSCSNDDSTPPPRQPSPEVIDSGEEKSNPDPEEEGSMTEPEEIPQPIPETVEPIDVVFDIPTPPEGKKWEIVPELTDEFNGTFDTDKWFKPLWNYGVPVQMVAQNSGVSDGRLWIMATLDNTNPDGRWFRTSRVQSRAQINYPMYTESKIKTAHISAYNTFWLNNGNIDDRDEIDVIENNSKPSCNCQPDFPWQMNSQYFQVNSAASPKEVRNHGNFDNRALSDANPLKGVKWNEEYHVFGVWWKDAKNAQFYLNGEEAGSVVFGEQRFDNEPFIEGRAFTRNLNIIWDLWTVDQPWLGGLPPKSDLSDKTINTMRVDWIHTYKLTDE